MPGTASARAPPVSPSSGRAGTRATFAPQSMPRLADVGELGLLSELERRGLAQRIEDDAAQVAGAVVTQDALVQGVHFRLDWISWRDLGFRAAAVNLSDLAASGAVPEALVVSLALPGTTESEDVVELYEGIAEAGVPVVGGDTTSAAQAMVVITAIGRAERVPGRDGARVGDVLVVTGPRGAAGAAFRDERYARPPLRLEEGRALARSAHAMLDLSDGLPVDAGHIARRSGVRCVIDLDAVPLADGATIDDLGFGEDYELLAALQEPGGHTVIGRVEAGVGVELLRDGEPTHLRGYEHFR